MMTHEEVCRSQHSIGCTAKIVQYQDAIFVMNQIRNGRIVWRVICVRFESMRKERLKKETDSKC